MGGIVAAGWAGAARGARHLPTTVSVLWRHAGRAGSKAGSVALRVSPGPVRDAARGAAVTRHRPDVAALAHAAAGDHRRARAVLGTALDRAATSASPGATARRLAAAAITLDQPDLADRALGLLAPDDPSAPVLAAQVAAVRGELDRALALAGRAPGLRGRQLARRLRGEREVLRHELLAGLPGPAPVADRRDPAARRVLHVVSNSLPEVQAGYTLRTQGIAQAQREAGLDPHVVTRLGFPVDSGFLTAPGEVQVDGVPHHRLLPGGRLPLPGRAMQQRGVTELTRLLDRLRPDLLHAHSKHENAQVALTAGRRAGVPVVYEVRGFLEETWRSRGGRADTDLYRWSREAETACMALADAVLTLSETMRQQILDRGIDADRVHVVPNAVSRAFLDPVPDGAPVRGRWGLRRDDVVLGTVTTLNEYEGVDVLVRALERLDDPGVRLLVVGDGPARSALQALASSLGERVVFTGRVPHREVRSHLAAMDIFCVPRRATPVTSLVPPLKPLEAMATGLPVLASDLPPLVETVQPGRFGRVVPPGDPDAWAEAVATLGYAPEHARSMGADARAWVARERTWSALVPRQLAAYGWSGPRHTDPEEFTRGS